MRITQIGGAVQTESPLRSAVLLSQLKRTPGVSAQRSLKCQIACMNSARVSTWVSYNSVTWSSPITGATTPASRSPSAPRPGRASVVVVGLVGVGDQLDDPGDRKSTRLNSSH